MKTKLLSLCIALICATHLLAYDCLVDGIYYNLNKTNKTAEVTSRTGGYNAKSYSGAVNIPASITYNKQTYSVTTIGQYAFYDCSGLTSVTIPNSVTKIGDYAFQLCSGLTSVTIGNSVTTIGDWAFYGCSGLTSVTIPNSVTTIEEGAFQGCSGLTSVTIPNSVTTIGDLAFRGCSSLTSITIPHSVTTIGDYAFYKCNGFPVIDNIRYADTYLVEVIDKSLSTYTIQDGTKWIGNSAFEDCSGLTSVTIPNSVTAIGQRAFEGCSGLTSISCHATIPPTCGSDCFYNVPTSIPVYVPARSVDAYKKATGWRTFTNLQGFPSDYAMVTCLASNGTITGGGKFIKGDICTLMVSPNYGYHFTQWSDGNTDNPRSFVITQDSTFTAEFAKNVYTFDVQTADSVMGSVTGTKGNYEYETNLFPTATPNYGYHLDHWSDGNKEERRLISLTQDTMLVAYFAKNIYSITIPSMANGSVQGAKDYEYLDSCTLIVMPDWGYKFTEWNDGNTDNPRTIVVTQDSTFTAQIDTLTAGQCGNNLYWKLVGDTLIITGSGEMYDYTESHLAEWYLSNDKITKLILEDGITSIGDYAFYGLSNKNLKEIALPNSVETIGKYAFAECSYLKTITLGAKLEDIDVYAFQNDERLLYVNCYAEEPPVLQENAFNNYDIYLQVPCEVLDEYKVAKGWKLFNRENVSCLSAEGKTVTGDDVTVAPSANDATFTWPANDQADSYSLEITKDSVVFCTLKFNANGQLTGIAFAPSRGHTAMAHAATTTSAGWQFTVTGLNQASKYAYTLDALNASQQSIKTYTGEFATDGYTDLETVDGSQCTMHNVKFIKDGRLLIERNGNLYNAHGARVK